MKACFYQICYSPSTFEAIEDGFIPLDNLANQRPDWREFWAIRNYLKNNYLSDDCFYGFFSPRFNEKTGLSHRLIVNFINENYTDQDVISFSPFHDFIGLFKNVFEQGDFFHPSLMGLCQLFSNEHLSRVDLEGSVMHSENSIFCNYFIANKRFWNVWSKIGEILFEISESGVGEISSKLNGNTSYGDKELPMKIFVQERIAAMCLLAEPSLKVLSYDPFKLGSSTTPLGRFYRESLMCNALKIAYAKTGNASYLDEFKELRNRVFRSAFF